MNREKEGHQKKNTQILVRVDKTFKNQLKQLSELRKTHYAKIIRALVNEAYLNEFNKNNSNTNN